MTTEQEMIEEIQGRLTYVMTTKETAVQQTLADTESCLAITRELKALLDMAASDPSLAKASVAGIAVIEKMSTLVEQTQTTLTHILMTQGYQDLTGQVLKRVMEDLMRLTVSGVAEQPQYSASQGFGPAALASEKQGRVTSQDDVDDLLKDVGF
jgi:chemotaxis protein CheZ